MVLNRILLGGVAWPSSIMSPALDTATIQDRTGVKTPRRKGYCNLSIAQRETFSSTAPIRIRTSLLPNGYSTLVCCLAFVIIPPALDTAPPSKIAQV